MRRYLAVIVTGLLIVTGTLAFGPRPDRDETVHFDPKSIGRDIDAYLRESEARFPDIKPGAQKHIVWADPENRTRTPLAIVYVHGFSATRMEIEPVTSNVARAMGANVYFMRLTGHGRDGAAMADASFNAWIDDIAEAIAIGERIGERVLLIGTSTGGTLATWAASRPELAARMAGIVMISPNYAVRGVSIGLLNMPWSEYLLPMVFGETRSFTPHNEQHGKWWTTSYPSKAVFAMGAMLLTVSEIDYSKIAVPALFIYSPQDKVVVPEAAMKVYGAWGGTKRSVPVNEAGDPSNHVIAGDILSPGNTDFVTGKVLEFIRNDI